MSPTIGRTVLYRLTEDQALATNKRREDARQNLDKMREERPGFQAHIGNPVSEGEQVPMLITAVWPNEFGPHNHGINGQATLDGNDSLWVTSVEEGEAPGQWGWPVIQA